MSEEQEDTLETFCLVAKYGDMSAHGMGDTAHVIIFNREYSDVVTNFLIAQVKSCLLYTSPSPRDLSTSRMPSSA